MQIRVTKHQHTILWWDRRLGSCLRCEHNKNKKEEWEKYLEIKLKDAEQFKNEDEEERGIVKEMLNYVNKNFDNDNNYCINH